MAREAGLNSTNVLHLLTLLSLAGFFAVFQIEYLEWHQDVVFPRWRAVMVGLTLVLQLNSVNNAMYVHTTWLPTIACAAPWTTGLGPRN
jgi:hypothetical protein